MMIIKVTVPDSDRLCVTQAESIILSAFVHLPENKDGAVATVCNVADRVSGSS